MQLKDVKQKMCHRVVIVLFIFISVLLAPKVSFGVTQGNKMQITLVSASEPVLNKVNLDRVKRFILDQGMRCTYSNMYNNNPCFELAGFKMYLNPDPGPTGNLQWNINCDISLGDFNTLVLHRVHATDDSRVIEFAHDKTITITLPDAGEDITERDLKDFPETAVLAMLRLIQMDRHASQGIE